MQGSGYLLIGYHQVDAFFAIKLALDLKNSGINVWLDRLDMTDDDDWIATSRSALFDCAVFMPVMSPDYVTSRYGKNEVELAHQGNCIILPILLRYVHANDWLPQVGYDHVDLTDWHSESRYWSILQQLKDRIESLGLVAIKQLMNPEMRYLNHVIAQVELQKNALAIIQLSHSKSHEETDEPDYRPELPIEPEWGLNGPFLLDLGTEMHLVTDLFELSLNQSQYVLVGANGIGKTTTLQRLLLDDARRYQEEPRYAPMPLYVSLGAWKQKETFQDFLQQYWWLKADIGEWLAQGWVKLYLDDLDNLHPDNLQPLQQWLEENQQTTRVILACLDSVYDQNFDFSFPIVRVESMTASRVESFIALALGAQGAVIFWQKLFPESRWEWALRNPLYLQLLLFVYRNAVPDELPKTPAQLISRWIDINWQREQILQHPNWIPFNDVIPALSRWAFDGLYTSSFEHSKVSNFLNYLPDEGIWNLLVSAHILHIQNKHIYFMYDALQHFFTAHFLRQTGIHTYLTQPVAHKKGVRLRSKWDLILIVLAGFEEDGESYLRQIIDVDPFLAVMAIIDGCSASDFMRRQVVLRLIDYALNQESALASEAANLLQQLYDGDAITVVLSLMRDGNWDERVLATHFLLEQSHVIPSDLQTVFDDWAWNIDQEVLSTLRFMTEDALPTLIHQLYDKDWKHRRGAAWALGELGDKAAVVALQDCLNDGNVLVKREIISALRRLKDGAVVDDLVHALLDDDMGVRKMAAYAVSEMNVSAIPSLLRLLVSEEPQVKRVALGVLGRLEDPTVIPDVLPYLTHADADIRAVAVNAIGNIANADNQVLTPLAPLLDDETVPRWSTQSISQLTQKSLEKIGTEDAMNLIQRFLQKKAKTTGSATRAKEMLRQQSSRHQTEEAITDENLLLEAQQLAPNEEKAPKELDANLEVIPQTSSDWVELLDDPDWRSRRQAIEMLSATGDVEHLPIILDALADDDNQVRWSAVKALVSYPAENTLNGLEQALYDTDFMVSYAAADVLRQIGQPSVTIFRQALQSVSADVRAIAVDSLGVIGDTSVEQELRTLLHDTEMPSHDKTVSVGDRVALALQAMNLPIETPMPIVQPHLQDTTSNTQLPQNDIIISPDWEPVATNSDIYHVEQDVPLSPVTYDAQTTFADNELEISPEWKSMWTHLTGDDWHLQQQAAKDLIRLVKETNLSHDRQFMECVTSGLSHPDNMIRWACVEALAWLGDIHTVPLLIQTLEDPTWTIRVAIVRTLTKIGHSSAVPPLIKLLHDKHELVREVTAQALGEFQALTAVDALTNLLDDEGFVARAAIEALGEIGSYKAVEPLLQMLPLVDEQLKWTIIEALGKIRASEAVTELIPYLDVDYVPLWDDTGEQGLAEITAIALERIGTQEAIKALKTWRAKSKSKSSKKG